MFLKNFFYYSRKERVGILLLFVLLLTSLVFGGLIDYYESRREVSPEQNDSLWMASFNDFVLASGPENKDSRHPASGPAPAQVEINYMHFDPNHADSLELDQLGLSAFAIKNLRRYRSKGGVFRNREDVRRIYGFTQEDWERLSPYIRIQSPSRKSTGSKSTENVKTVSVRASKYPKGTILDLNTADTISLIRIPGIGPSMARRIVNYRNRLGGFYKVSQLKEIRYFEDSLTSWFQVHSPMLQTLRINQLEREELTAHPYLNFAQCRVILEYRKKHGRITDLKKLALYEEFKPSDLKRLEPYVDLD